MEEELIEGMNSVVVEFPADSMVVRLGWWSAQAPEFVVPVAYSWMAFLIAICRLATSSLVKLWRISLTLSSLRIVSGILGADYR